MRHGSPYDTAKGQPWPLSPRDFKSKKLEIPLAPMLNRKRLQRSRSSIRLTPPHAQLKDGTEAILTRRSSDAIKDS